MHTLCVQSREFTHTLCVQSREFMYTLCVQSREFMYTLCVQLREFMHTLCAIKHFLQTKLKQSASGGLQKTAKKVSKSLYAKTDHERTLTNALQNYLCDGFILEKRC